MTPEEMAPFDGPDDPDVPDDEIFWRRIYAAGWIVPDGPDGSRLSSQAYEESKGPVSPCSVIRAAESTVEHVQQHESNGVGAITAGVLRANGFKLVRHNDPNEPGHYHIVGANDKRKHKHVRLKLADSTTHVAGPQWGPGIAPPK